MEFNENVSSGYRVLRSGNNIIYTGKICKEGAAEFQLKTYDAIAELNKREAAIKQQNTNAAKNATINGVKKDNGNQNPSTQSPQKQAAPAAPAEKPEKPLPTVPPSIAPEDPAVVDVKAVKPAATSSLESEVSNNSCSTSSTSSTSVVPGLSQPEYVYNPSIPSVSNDNSQSLMAGIASPQSASGGGSGGSGSTPAAGTKTAGGGAPTALNTLRFHFTSAGGNLPAGVAMMDMVEEAGRMGYHTECFSKGFVGSAATFPAFACKQRFATDHALFLLHPPAKSNVHGQTEELQIHSQNLDMWHSTSNMIYQRLKRFPFPKRGVNESDESYTKKVEQVAHDKENAGHRIETSFSNNRYDTAKNVIGMGLIDHILNP